VRVAQDGGTKAAVAVQDEERIAGSSTFGPLLRRYRLAAGLSQEALAERARVSTNGIGALERGDRRTPQRETLTLLAQALALNAEQRRGFEAAARSGFPSARVAARASNLPHALTSFVGRERELAEIVQLVRERRLVTLTGTGGIGKTRTGMQAAMSLGDIADDGVWVVELAPVRDASFVASELADVLGVQSLPNRPLLETLIGFLKQKKLLLILDNCEHVIAEAAAVTSALLRGCPGLRILATSREPMRVAGEQTYNLPPLGDAAIELFADRARAVDRKFALEDGNAQIVEEICLRLDGIPLAIELAAARVKILPVKALSEKLDQRFRILTDGDRTALARHQTLRALIDWSYELLTGREQHLFETLSVFAAGCTLATATAVFAPEADLEVLELLSSLVDKSLAIADFEFHEPRYRMLESSREYAREKLVARGEAAAVADRFARVCLAVAEQLERSYDTEPERLWRETARAEVENWRASLDWALTKRNAVLLGQQIVVALYQVWGRFAAVEGWRWVRAALEGALFQVWGSFAAVEGRGWIAAAVAAVDATTPPKIVAKLDCAESWNADWFGDYATALGSAERALALYRAMGNPLGVARAHLLAGRALCGLGRVAEAEPLLQDALAFARSIDNRQLLGFVLTAVAAEKSLERDFAQARKYNAEALAIYEELGAGRAAARTIAFDLAELEFLAGDMEAARRLAADAVDRQLALGDTNAAACTLGNLAAYLTALDRFEEASDRAHQALDLARERQLDVVAALALQHLAAAAALRRDTTDERKRDAQLRAARLVGFVDARLAELGSIRAHTDEQEYDRLVAALERELGTGPFAAAVADGAPLLVPAAIEVALTMSPVLKKKNRASALDHA